MPVRLGARSLDPAHIGLLHDHPVFGGLSSDQLARLYAFATTRKVACGSAIFAKGDPGTSLFAICRGSVKIAVPSVDGREAIFNLIHAGEIFGEIALLDGRPRTADAVAVTDVELLVIDRRDFLKFVNDEPSVAIRLMELLCARLRWSSEHFEELVFLDLPKRLAKTLLRLAGEERSPAQNGKLVITQREIGQMLGLSRESINKQLRQWEKAGWVRLERGLVNVLAPDSLVRIVELN